MNSDFPDYAAMKPTLAWQLPFEGAWPSALAFLDGGRRLAVGNQAGTILVWDLLNESAPRFAPVGERKSPGLAPGRRLVGHTNGITRLLPSPDGSTLYSASLDHTVRAWRLADAASGEEELVLDVETREREAKRAGKKATDEPGVRIETQTSAQVWTGHDDWVSALALSRDGKRLVSGDYSARVIVRDALNGSELGRFSGLAWNWIISLAVSPDGGSVAVSEFRYKRDDFDVPSAALRVWSLAERQPTLDLLKVQFPKYDPAATSYDAAQTWRKFVGDGLQGADISPDGKLLAVGQGGETDTGKVHLFELEQGKLLRTISGHQYGITDIRFSHDGRFVLSVGRDTSLRICEVAEGKEVAVLGAPRGGQFKDWLSALALAPDGRTIAATDIAGIVHVWKVG